jgi:hypothetical protein
MGLMPPLEGQVGTRTPTETKESEQVVGHVWCSNLHKRGPTEHALRSLCARFHFAFFDLILQCPKSSMS